MTTCIMRERSDRLFGYERSEPSWQDRAPRSEAQRSAVQQLVSDIRKNVSSSADEAEVWPEWIDYNRRGAAAFPINNVTSDR